MKKKQQTVETMMQKRSETWKLRERPFYVDKSHGNAQSRATCSPDCAPVLIHSDMCERVCNSIRGVGQGAIALVMAMLLQ